jgi:hypothetical protein
MRSKPERGAPERKPGAPEGARVPAPPPEARPDEEQRFIDDLIARGEAVPEGQELPPGATHEIVVDEQGHRTVRRKRFSAY